MSAAVAVELDQVEKRARVVDLAKTGMSYSQIAAEVGYASKQSVANQIQAWAAETRPSREDSDAFRAMQLERLEAMHAKLWPLLSGDDVLPVTDRLLKIAERASRLMGADLERSVTINLVPSAEQIASALGWDEPSVVEGVATEITDA